MMNEPIQGSFYASELQKVSKDEQTQWSIEKIIRKRKVGGKPEVLVQWLGWPKKFDSWIPEIDVKKFDIPIMLHLLYKCHCRWFSSLRIVRPRTPITNLGILEFAYQDPYL